MSAREIASQIAESAKAADAVLADFLSQPEQSEEALAAAIKKYIAVKQQLSGDEVSDNITIMVRISISKATGIPVEKLKEMDKAGACGSAPAVLAKRVLLFIDIQKKLGVAMAPEKAGGIQTVQDLSGILYPLIRKTLDR